MEAEIQKLFDSFANLQEKANVNAVFGEPVTVENRTVIPVARVAYGFGMGIGHGTMAEEEVEEKTTEETVEETVQGVGGGGGSGLLARPFAIVEVTPEGTRVKSIVEVTPEGTRVKSIVDEQKLALAGVLLIGWIALCLARTLVKIFGQDGRPQSSSNT
ncbi:MAG: spore germination protein GerW family protein [Chloroflexota bacterium]|nr:spore germination protein GerW family protein [Chloroflexota bacterium]